MFDIGTLTMKNYGLRRNCTTSIIYPEQIHMLNVDVGVTSETKPIEAETGLKNTVNIFYELPVSQHSMLIFEVCLFPNFVSVS